LSYAVFAILLIIIGFGLLKRLKEPSENVLTEGEEGKASV
jgi:hypothetical protein